MIGGVEAGHEEPLLVFNEPESRASGRRNWDRSNAHSKILNWYYQESPNLLIPKEKGFIAR